jgi:hypothetical protein
MSIERLAELVNGQDKLVHRGRFLDLTFLVGVGDEDWTITIAAGRIAEVARGPFLMPNVSFTLRASAEDWAVFWSADPPPGYHDLFALLKFKRLKLEGDMHPFMSNLFYFKGVLVALRGVA